MGLPRREPVVAADLCGFKYFDLIMPLLGRLRNVCVTRDKAYKRRLFYDHVVTLLLLYFYSPIVTSLRGLQQASDLDKVQRLLGTPHASLGSLSESAALFDPAPLRGIVQELARQALPLQHGPDAQALHDLTAVDGTILPALPKMAWALWQDAEHRGVKMHLHFEVLKGVPCDAKITPAASSEPGQMGTMLEAGRLYVQDRGYAGFKLFQEILAAHSSFIGRVQEGMVFKLKENRPLTDADRSAGVVRDALLFHVGSRASPYAFYHALRLVIVRRTKADNTPEDLWLLTDRLDLSAELVALAYRYRWTVELFFRWFKRILGCRHLLFNSANGVAIQCYVGLIATLLVVLWTGLKPNKRTWEMIQWYLIGMATLEEVQAHIEKLKAQQDRDKARR